MVLVVFMHAIPECETVAAYFFAPAIVVDFDILLTPLTGYSSLRIELRIEVWLLRRSALLKNRYMDTARPGKQIEKNSMVAYLQVSS